MVIVVCVLISIIVFLVTYIMFIQLQLRNINKQLDKRLSQETRQPISLELVNRELNNLVANINNCLTEDEQLRLESVKREKQLKELIISISHDLRTPLTAIRGYQQLMEKGTLLEEQMQKLKIAQKHTDELGNLIEHFFEYSYITNIEPELHFERINLTNLVAECIAESVEGFEINNLSVYFEESMPVFVFADNGIITRIIRNLIQNCIRHSAGEIKVQIYTAKNVIISFRNPVKNISEIDVERIFDRFYTSDKTRSKGTGLGLSIVKLLTEKMGGNVKAHIVGGIIEIHIELPVLVDFIE